jgi:protein involved in polysaccharide export with SLBB domain
LIKNLSILTALLGVWLLVAGALPASAESALSVPAAPAVVISSPAAASALQPVMKQPPAAAGSVAQASAPQGAGGALGPEGVKAESSPDVAAVKGADTSATGGGEASYLEKSVAATEKGAENGQPQSYRPAELVQFGYNFFRPSATGFAPLIDVPVGPDYQIGPGDRIIVTLWGSVEGTYELEVNRSGEIFLPRVGAVKVWGVTFGKLGDLVKNSLKKAVRDFELNVTMGKLRVIKVFVVGEVKAPGDYNLTALSTLINALGAAGGPLKSGTLRNIQVKRGGVVVETVDLYDFFLNGDKSRDIRLQPGDTIFVPVIGKVATVAGNVKRQAIYELKGEKNLAEVMDLAGGVLPTGYLQRVHISRVEAYKKNTVADFNVDPKDGDRALRHTLEAVPVQDMDVVRVYPIDAALRGYVKLTGYVLRPGDYALQPGMRLSSLLLLDNLLPEYYAGAVKITRLYPPDFHPESFFVNPVRAVAGDPVHDLELKEFDTIKVFSRWEMEEMPKVKVSGEVQRPGQYRLSGNMTVRDLVMEAGNLKMTAYLKNAEISRTERSGEKVSASSLTVNLEEALNGNPKENLALMPLDELTVRRIPNWAEETERYITLKGEFRFPGVYPVYRGETLNSVIKRAGGFTDKAYLKGAKFTRLSIREIQQKRQREILARTEQEIVKKQADLAEVATSREELEATRVALEGLKKNVGLLKSVEPEGRLVIRLEEPEKFADSRYNVAIQGGDVLDVPQEPSSVNILGQVYNPTSLIPVEGEDVAYYLAKSGGPTKEADENDIYVVKIDGTVISKQQFSWFSRLLFSGFMSQRLDSGDTVVVPQQYEKIAWLREIKDMAVILGQIALSAGVLIAAGL